MGVDLPHGIDDPAGEKVANWGLPSRWREGLDLDHLVHGHANDLSLVLDQHYGAVRAGRAVEEAGNEVDHGNDRASDVHEPADVRRRPGETRGGRGRKNLPHDLQLDPTDAIRQLEEEQLAGRYVRAVR